MFLLCDKALPCSGILGQLLQKIGEAQKFVLYTLEARTQAVHEEFDTLRFKLTG